MDKIILIFKGIIIGIGKILPGVSGSVLAISLNVYEKAINCISNLFNDFKNNTIYLSCLGVGIVLSIFFGSKTLLFLLNKYYFYTFSIIIGLIIGTIPPILKETKKSDLIYTFIPILIIVLFNNVNLNLNINELLLSFLLGFIEAFTTIVPGISSSAIYISLGIYEFYLNLFINIFSVNFMIFFLNLIIGIFLTSKLVNYLFINCKRQTHIIIFNLLLLSILMLFKNILVLSNFNILIFIIFLTIGFVISGLLNK